MGPQSNYRRFLEVNPRLWTDDGVFGNYDAWIDGWIDPEKQASLTMGISCLHWAQEFIKGRITCRDQRKGLRLTSSEWLDLLSHFRGSLRIS